MEREQNEKAIYNQFGKLYAFVVVGRSMAILEKRRWTKIESKKPKHFPLPIVWPFHCVNIWKNAQWYFRRTYTKPILCMYCMYLVDCVFVILWHCNIILSVWTDFCKIVTILMFCILALMSYTSSHLFCLNGWRQNWNGISRRKKSRLLKLTWPTLKRGGKVTTVTSSIIRRLCS